MTDSAQRTVWAAISNPKAVGDWVAAGRRTIVRF